MKSDFEKELEVAVNRNNREQFSNCPDFILARYLIECLEAFEVYMQRKAQGGASKAQMNYEYWLECEKARDKVIKASEGWKSPTGLTNEFLVENGYK